MMKIDTLKSGPACTLSHAVCQIVVVVLCAACSKEPAPVAVPAKAPEAVAAAAPQVTGLVKNPVKMTDTPDAVKWMDMASTKSPAQIAKEEKLAREAADAKLAAEAKKARDDRLAADAKSAADAKIAADAKAAADARALAAAKALESQKLAEASQAQAAARAKAAAVAVQEPVLSVITRVQPKFPKMAATEGITSGVVTAQVQIDTDGHVSKVDILKASPKKYFDKAVLAAASQWKYAPISKPMTTTLEFDFKLDDDGS